LSPVGTTASLPIIWALGRFACDKQNFPCPRISAGERESSKYPGLGFLDANQEISGPNRTHLFSLLRASVPPWCKGLGFFFTRLCRHVSRLRPLFSYNLKSKKKTLAFREGPFFKRSFNSYCNGNPFSSFTLLLDHHRPKPHGRLLPVCSNRTPLGRSGRLRESDGCPMRMIFPNWLISMTSGFLIPPA